MNEVKLAAAQGSRPVAYIRTYPLTSDGGGQRTHLEGVADAATLCGDDASGDDKVHRKQPVTLAGKHRITCPHCLGIIALVKEHLGANTEVRHARASDERAPSVGPSPENP